MKAEPKRFGELVCFIVEQKVDIYFDGDRLRWRAPAGVMTEQWKEELRRFKPTLKQIYDIAQYHRADDADNN